MLQISLERRTQICRRCGAETDRVHDYRIRQVRDLELRGKPLRLLYRRRRYVCPVCGKRFAEQNTFVGRYMRFTHRTGEKIMTLLRRRSSMKDIAKDAGVSISGVQRVLKMAPVSKPKRLPEAVSFDEFKGNAGGARFQCIVTDPLNRRVFDILPSRTVETVQDYLRSFPNRDEVKYVAMDMNRGFRDAAKAFLPNAKIIIDRFHVVRYCTEALQGRPRRRGRDAPLFRSALAGVCPQGGVFDFMAAPRRNEAEHVMDFWLEACKRLSFGFRSFSTFRARILLVSCAHPYI
ncbi:ISL3 family transposase [Butyricicoccus sp.]|uniref:ISL3 family transposase n=1 Tax=Butyricicoccus sp. TaxID=2049021 RepID=UPI003AAB4B12